MKLSTGIIVIVTRLIGLVLKFAKVKLFMFCHVKIESNKNYKYRMKYSSVKIQIHCQLYVPGYYSEFRNNSCVRRQIQYFNKLQKTFQVFNVCRFDVILKIKVVQLTIRLCMENYTS